MICTLVVHAFHDSCLRIRLLPQVYAADIFASKFGDGHPNLYAGLQFRDKVRKHIRCFSFIVVVCEYERTNNYFLPRCWPQEEAKNQWNFSPIFLEGNHQHKLSSIAGQTLVCSILHLTLGSSNESIGC